MPKTSYDYSAVNRRESPKKRSDKRFSHEELAKFRGREKEKEDEKEKLRKAARRRDTA
jgi:hypothetical protein